MKKILISIIVSLAFVLSIGLMNDNDSNANETSFDFTYDIVYDGEIKSVGTIQDVTSGQVVTFDQGSLHITGFDFIGFIVKNDETLDFQSTITVSEETNATAYFKETGKTAVVFLDEMQDFLTMVYTDSESNTINQSMIPDYSGFTKDEVDAAGWSIDLAGTFTNDIVVTPTFNEGVVATYIQEFNMFTSATSTYSTSESFTDEYGFAWDLFGRQSVGSWMFGNAEDGSYVEVVAENGISRFSADFVRSFTNNNARSVELFINNVSYGSFDIDVSSDEWQYFEVNNINVAGTVTIKLVSTSPGTRGAFNVDNIEWDALGGGVEKEPEEDMTAPVITPDNDKFSYPQGSTIELGCTAIDDVDGEVPCTYEGTIDTSTLGSYDITYTATDANGNIATLIKTYVIYDYSDYLSMDLMPYYDNAEGLTGLELAEALRIIISNYHHVTYGEARYILDESDADPNNPGNIILVYTQVSVDGTWDAGATWNREHVWPQSLLGNDSIMIEDLHNLKPADPGENSSRSNKYFDYITDSDSYEPPLEVKGDIARILFYMMIRYDQLTLIDGVPSTYQMGLLEVLLEWHYIDPVDDFERNRNEVIYFYQENRNPFVDYEHFVEMIFGDHPYFNAE